MHEEHLGQTRKSAKCSRWARKYVSCRSTGIEMTIKSEVLNSALFIVTSLHTVTARGTKAVKNNSGC